MLQKSDKKSCQLGSHKNSRISVLIIRSKPVLSLSQSVEGLRRSSFMTSRPDDEALVRRYSWSYNAWLTIWNWLQLLLTFSLPSNADNLPCSRWMSSHATDLSVYAKSSSLLLPCSPFISLHAMFLHRHVFDKFSITVYVWCSYLSCWARLYLASHSGVDFFLSCHRCCWQRYTSSVDERLKHWHLKQYVDILSFIAYHKNAHCVDFHPSTCTSTDTCSRWQCSGWYVIATFVNMNAVLNATRVPVVN